MRFFHLRLRLRLRLKNPPSVDHWARPYDIKTSGLPKVTFLAVAEAVAVYGKTSATEAEAVAEAEGLDFNKILVVYQFA